jgi:hypothetical protein
MTILWYGSEEDRHLFAPKSQQALEITDSTNLKNIELVVIEACYGSSSHSYRHGLRWLQEFRLRSHIKAPALVYSFETREYLATTCSMMTEGVPGIGFLRIPFSVEEFTQESSALSSLTDDELGAVIRWHSGLQDQWRTQIHQLHTEVQGLPNNKETVIDLLEVMSGSVKAFAVDQLSNLESLLNSVVNSNSEEDIRERIGLLGHGLINDDRGGAVAHYPNAASSQPPPGFEAIGIADNDGYIPSTITALQAMGYKVGGPARNMNEASSLLEYFLPNVVLSDYNFPTPREGRVFMRRALLAPSVRLVIAVSRAPLSNNELPYKVVNCCGGPQFYDASLIHNIIWKYAQEAEW